MDKPLLLIILCFASHSLADSYNRSDFNYQSYKVNTSIGFYTNQSCDFINIDHIVSLKDAYYSGGASWSAPEKEAFANDRSDLSPDFSTMTLMRFPVNLMEWRSQYEETIQRRTNY